MEMMPARMGGMRSVDLGVSDGGFEETGGMEQGVERTSGGSTFDYPVGVENTDCADANTGFCDTVGGADAAENDRHATAHGAKEGLSGD